MGRRHLFLRIILAIGALVVVVVAVALWGLFWPAPQDVPSLKCGPHPPVRRCVQISGRVIFSTRRFNVQGDRSLHVVLLSRSSVTFPGITSVELPPLATVPPGFGTGEWASFVGYETTGSHGEQDIHAFGFATAHTNVRCAGSWGGCGHRRQG